MVNPNFENRYTVANYRFKQEKRLNADGVRKNIGQMVWQVV